MNYEELDFNVREVVRWLRFFHFDTCDSGDGESKEEEARVFSEPHVISRIAKEEIITAADFLHRVIKCLTDEEFRIECSYDPSNEIALIILFGVKNSSLKVLCKYWNNLCKGETDVYQRNPNKRTICAVVT